MALRVGAVVGRGVENPVFFTQLLNITQLARLQTIQSGYYASLALIWRLARTTTIMWKRARAW